MNIFVLCTGRCGSTTFVEAAKSITNYSAGHETLRTRVASERLAYPRDHIEADNRLSWFLGRVDRTYGNDARYVHLTREPDAVVESFLKRWNLGIIKAYRTGILLGADGDRKAVCRDYVDTVTANIRAFLKDKSYVLDFRLEDAAIDWQRFWDWAGAEGNYEASASAWSRQYNASKPRRPREESSGSGAGNLAVEAEP